MQIGEDLMEAYFEECRACLGDQIVQDADVLDAGMIFGTGFAPFRGGPLHYLRQLESQDRAEPANDVPEEPELQETVTEDNGEQDHD